MKINELTKKTGLAASTIRFYEQKGLLDTKFVRRGENNYRDYVEESVEHLLMIKYIQAAGFTLAEFKEMDDACYNAENKMDVPRIAAFFRQKIAEIAEKKAELDRAQMYLNKALAEILEDEEVAVPVR